VRTSLHIGWLQLSHNGWYLLLGHYLREEPHGWEDLPGSFGIPATTQKQQERLEHELRNRPQNCDADHKRGRDHPTANGVHGVVSVRRENTIRSIVQAQFNEDWDGPFLTLHTNGNIALAVVQGIVSPCDVQVPLRTHNEQNTCTNGDTV
jgi:hypothetical protein